jgi:type II secretory ATPase GspE/PulE/Tfp pilus assembly ATPase PilB-like protein
MDTDNRSRLLEEQNTENRARLLGLQYIDTSQLKDRPLFGYVLSVQELYEKRVIPLLAAEHAIQFGITTTTSQQTMTELRSRFADQQITYYLISETGFREYMKLYDPPPEVVYQDISITQADTSAVAAQVEETLGKIKAEDMLAYLTQQAYRLTASDIHLENDKDTVRIRFRVDGVLHHIARLDKQTYHILLSAIASAANVSTNAPDAQSGNINRTVKMADGSEVVLNLRLETVPALYGTDAVLRLFNFKPEFLHLDKLGLSADEKSVIQDILRNPTGLVLIVGPTGSGKTTTLYSMINELNNDERKIITLEEPVEYVISGITQIPVASRREGDGFGEKLRAVLRLDPDVIMVGEIRDNDTAKTALQASLTGHLVLSTYHAGSTAAALTRMLDAIGENPLFVNAIRLITSQRLVRQLDNATKQAYSPDEATMRYIEQTLESLPANVAKPDLAAIQLYHPGSSPEYPFGYNGQFAIRELMVMRPALRTILRKPAREVTTEDLEQAARDDGMLTMRQDGVLKALQGLTTIDEVIRVVG